MKGVWLDNMWHGAGHGSAKPKKKNLKEKDQVCDCLVQASFILEVNPGQASLTPSQDFRKRAPGGREARFLYLGGREFSKWGIWQIKQAGLQEQNILITN